MGNKLAKLKKKIDSQEIGVQGKPTPIPDDGLVFLDGARHGDKIYFRSLRAYREAKGALARVPELGEYELFAPVGQDFELVPSDELVREVLGNPDIQRIMDGLGAELVAVKPSK